MEYDFHIAPCGINCSLCTVFQRKQNRCNGCHSDWTRKPKHCADCFIKNCNLRTSPYCYSCRQFPCTRLKNLEIRYRKNYQIGPLQNLEIIRRQGIEYFITQETDRWTCSRCGQLKSVHQLLCPHCNQ